MGTRPTNVATWNALPDVRDPGIPTAWSVDYFLSFDVILLALFAYV